MKFKYLFFSISLIGTAALAQDKLHDKEPVLVKPSREAREAFENSLPTVEGFKDCLKSLENNNLSKFKDGLGNDKAEVQIQSQAFLVKPFEVPKPVRTYTWLNVRFNPAREEELISFDKITVEQMNTMIDQIEGDLSRQYASVMSGIKGAFTNSPDHTADGARSTKPLAEMTMLQKSCAPYFLLPDPQAYVYARDPLENLPVERPAFKFEPKR